MMWLNSKIFKMPFAKLLLDLTELVMPLPLFKNYTGSLLHTASCLINLFIYVALPAT